MYVKCICAKAYISNSSLYSMYIKNGLANDQYRLLWMWIMCIEITYSSKWWTKRSFNCSAKVCEMTFMKSCSGFHPIDKDTMLKLKQWTILILLIKAAGCKCPNDCTCHESKIITSIFQSKTEGKIITTCAQFATFVRLFSNMGKRWFYTNKAASQNRWVVLLWYMYRSVKSTPPTLHH